MRLLTTGRAFVAPAIVDALPAELPSRSGSAGPAALRRLPEPRPSEGRFPGGQNPCGTRRSTRRAWPERLQHALGLAQALPRQRHAKTQEGEAAGGHVAVATRRSAAPRGVAE